MELRCMPNSGHGGPHLTRVIPCLCFCVSRQVPNINKFQIYEVYKSREVSHLLSHQNFLSNGVRIKSRDQFLTPVMTISINVIILDIRTVGRSGGRTVGRSDGRTVGRADGRAGGRSGGRTVGRTDGRARGARGAD